MNSKGKHFFKILLILSLSILVTSCSSSSADTTDPSASPQPTVDATGPKESPQPTVDAMATFTQSEGDIDVNPSFTTENTLVETPEYTGVIISENGASEFSYLFDKASTGFREPSVNDISRAEECIRQHIVSVQDNPKLDTYQKESIVVGYG